MGNFCDKNTEITLHEICVQVFLRFSDSSQPSQSISLIYKLAWLAGIRKSEENLLKTSFKLLLWPKLLTYFDDVTPIENNRQVGVNIDATLVAMFHIISVVNVLTINKIRKIRYINFTTNWLKKL